MVLSVGRTNKKGKSIPTFQDENERRIYKDEKIGISFGDSSAFVR